MWLDTDGASSRLGLGRHGRSITVVLIVFFVVVVTAAVVVVTAVDYAACADQQIDGLLMPPFLGNGDCPVLSVDVGLIVPPN